VKPVTPAAARHEPTGELVDDGDLAVLHHVVAVALVERVRAEGLLHVMERLDLARVVEVGDPQPLLDLLHPVVGEADAAGLLVQRVVLIRNEPRDDPVDPEVLVGVLLGGSGDDERCPRLVDKDAVHLVDDREVQLALDVVAEPELHVVAEVVEPELVVLTVGDVAAVGGLALGIVEVVDDAAHGQAEEVVDPAHPLGVAAGEVVVHGHDVDAASAERIEVARQRGGEGLALAGAHLGDAPLVEEHPADELDVEVALADGPARRLAGQGEGLVQHVVQGTAVRHLLLQSGRLARERIIGELPHPGLEGVDAGDAGPGALELALVLRPEDLLQRPLDHDVPVPM
jgi:hypothetical protein